MTFCSPRAPLHHLVTHVYFLFVCGSVVQCKAKFPGRQLVYVSRNWGFSPFPKDVYTDGRQMTAEGKIQWRGLALSNFLFLSLSFFLSLIITRARAPPHAMPLPSLFCPLPSRIIKRASGASPALALVFPGQAPHHLQANHIIKIEKIRSCVASRLPSLSLRACEARVRDARKRGRVRGVVCVFVMVKVKESVVLVCRHVDTATYISPPRDACARLCHCQTTNTQLTLTSGATGIIKGDGVGTKFASAKSVRLSKLGIWHKTSGDIKSRPSEAMRLNWTL